MNEDSKLKIAGAFTYQHLRDGVVIDEWKENNLVVDEGLTYILGTALDGATVNIPSFYIGIYSGNYTPISSDTAANIATNSTEVTAAYSETTRVPWVEAGVASLTVGNTASPAVFTFTAATTDIYGAFLVSTSVKGGTLGTLISASKFATSRTMLVTDVLNVTYNIATSAT